MPQPTSSRLRACGAAASSLAGMSRDRGLIVHEAVEHVVERGGFGEHRSTLGTDTEPVDVFSARARKRHEAAAIVHARGCHCSEPDEPNQLDPPAGRDLHGHTQRLAVDTTRPALKNVDSSLK